MAPMPMKPEKPSTAMCEWPITQFVRCVTRWMIGRAWKGPWRQTIRYQTRPAKTHFPPTFAWSAASLPFMVSHRLTSTASTGRSMPIEPVTATTLSQVGMGVWSRWCAPIWG